MALPVIPTKLSLRGQAALSASGIKYNIDKRLNASGQIPASMFPVTVEYEMITNQLTCSNDSAETKPCLIGTVTFFNIDPVGPIPPVLEADVTTAFNIIEQAVQISAPGFLVDLSKEFRISPTAPLGTTPKSPSLIVECSSNKLRCVEDYASLLDMLKAELKEANDLKCTCKSKL